MTRQEAIDVVKGSDERNTYQGSGEVIFALCAPLTVADCLDVPEVNAVVEAVNGPAASPMAWHVRVEIAASSLAMAAGKEARHG